MKIGIVCKILLFTICFVLAAFSGIFILVDNQDNSFRSSGKQLVENVSNESSLKETTDTREDNIIQKVNLQENFANSQGHWDDSETFVIDIKKFEEAAKSGRINIILLEKNFEIEIDEITVLSGKDSSHYSGHVKGVPYSKVEFYTYGEVFCGSIESGDLMYTVAVTSEKYNGKTVHVVFLINWENEREKMKDILNPLNSKGRSDLAKDLQRTNDSDKQCAFSDM